MLDLNNFQRLNCFDQQTNSPKTHDLLFLVGMILTNILNPINIYLTANFLFNNRFYNRHFYLEFPWNDYSR